MTGMPEDIKAVAESLAADLPMAMLTDPEFVATAIANALFSERIAAEKRGAERERERAASTGYRVCAETRHVTLGDQVAAAIRKEG